MTSGMELLSILYALLAAVTGVGAVERVAVPAPVAVEAGTEASQLAHAEHVAAAAVLLFHRAQPQSAYWQSVRDSRTLWAMAPATSGRLFAIASFANRRE
jgi:Na+-transporting methylmalonyl-CoA/oxaloacetate decarboxylase gamma subunit